MKFKNFSLKSENEFSEIKSTENSDIAKLVALLLTDGSVSIASRTCRIVFAGNCDELHHEFKRLMQQVFGIHNFYIRTDSKGVKITVCSSVNAGKTLREICNTFRTKACKTFPICGKFRNRPNACLKCKAAIINGIQFPTVNINILKKLSKDDLYNVLKLMFSADGGVVLGVKWHKTLNKWEFTRRIVLKCSNPNLRKKLKKLLHKINIDAKEWDSSLAIDKKSDIKRFSENIKFIDSIEVSPKSIYWTGFKKNDVLIKLLKTYNYKKSFWDKFSNKEDIINYLHTA